MVEARTCLSTCIKPVLNLPTPSLSITNLAWDTQCRRSWHLIGMIEKLLLTSGNAGSSNPLSNEHLCKLSKIPVCHISFIPVWHTSNSGNLFPFGNVIEPPVQFNAVLQWGLLSLLFRCFDLQRAHWIFYWCKNSNQCLFEFVYSYRLHDDVPVCMLAYSKIFLQLESTNRDHLTAYQNNFLVISLLVSIFLKFSIYSKK